MASMLHKRRRMNRSFILCAATLLPGCFIFDDGVDGYTSTCNAPLSMAVSPPFGSSSWSEEGYAPTVAVGGTLRLESTRVESCGALQASGSPLAPFVMLDAEDPATHTRALALQATAAAAPRTVELAWEAYPDRRYAATVAAKPLVAVEIVSYWDYLPRGTDIAMLQGEDAGLVIALWADDGTRLVDGAMTVHINGAENSDGDQLSVWDVLWLREQDVGVEVVVQAGDGQSATLHIPVVSAVESLAFVEPYAAPPYATTEVCVKAQAEGRAVLGLHFDGSDGNGALARGGGDNCFLVETGGGDVALEFTAGGVTEALVLPVTPG